MNRDKARERALIYIKKWQLSDGSFLSLAGETPFLPDKERQTTFITSLILGCLVSTDSATAQTIIKLAVAFLLDQKSRHWSWNYWTKSSKKFGACPDDIDDTAAALIALSLHAPKLLTEKAWSAITKNLISCEQQPGGPYETWIMAERGSIWRDIDPVVNASLAYFLKLHDIDLPTLTAFCDEAILKESASKYYESYLSQAYFYARVVSSQQAKEKLIQGILKHQIADKSWGSSLKTALALTSLLRLGFSVGTLKPAYSYLETIALNNNWQPEALYLEEDHKKKNYAGAVALSAAFTYEALSLWQKKYSEETAADGIEQISPVDHLQKKIVMTVKNRLLILPSSTQQSVHNILDKLLKADTEKQITLLPYYFFTTVDPSREKIVFQLGCANLYGWLAYTIYDDILDGDSSPALLPAANIFLRELISIYDEILTPIQKQRFKIAMDKMEAANAWEYANCRCGSKILLIDLPDYTDLQTLADKSLPHAFGPLALLYRLDYDDETAEIKNTLHFFKHYLIARQLNDDAHDCFSDLEQGRINSVATMTLRTFFKQTQRQAYDIKNDLPQLREIFWTTEINAVSAVITFHIKQARLQLTALPIPVNKNYLNRLLTPLEAAADEAITETARLKNFMSTFQKN